MPIEFRHCPISDIALLVGADELSLGDAKDRVQYEKRVTRRQFAGECAKAQSTSKHDAYRAVLGD
jgi:hypothetical protein